MKKQRVARPCGGPHVFLSCRNFLNFAFVFIIHYIYMNLVIFPVTTVRTSVLCAVMVFSLGFASNSLVAQCELAVNERDPFDSTRLIIAPAVPIGNYIPSLYETMDGPRIIEEAEVLFSFTESDREERLESFFLTLALPEYGYEPIEAGQNVLLALSDSTVIGLHNFPDKGTFHKATNMRIYQHTCVVPVDTYYRLGFLDIVGIRIRYKNKKRTIFLTLEQQAAIKEAIMCVGEEVGYRVRP